MSELLLNKTCSICNIDKSIDDFYYYEKTRVNGEKYIYYYPYCKNCAKRKATESNFDKELKNQRTKEWKKRPENKEKLKKHRKKRRETGKERKWRQENKDKIKEYNDYREQHKKHNISDEEWLACKEYFDNSCAYCGLHVENHFKKWNDEYRKQDLHKEHVDHNGSNDLSNCVPSCQSCNSSKWEFSLDEWYNEDNPKFEQERLERIHKWLKEDYLRYIE